MKTNDWNYDSNGVLVNPLQCDGCGVVSDDVKSDTFGDYCDDCRAVESGY
jgi:hypothetical protein